MTKPLLSSEIPLIIKSYLREFNNTGASLLQLQGDGSFTVTGEDRLFASRSVQFFVDRTTNDKRELVFRFRSAEDPTKYLAVSGTDIVSKSAEEITDDSYSFIVEQPNNDYLKFRSVLSPSDKAMFITADKDGRVFVADDSPSDPRRAWFRAVPIEENITRAVDVVVGTSNMTIEITRMVSVEE